jgi:hypothetical protein
LSSCTARELLHLDVEADLLQVELQDLRAQRSRAAVLRVEHDLPVAHVALRELLRVLHVHVLERVEIGVAEAGHPGREDGRSACPRGSPLLQQQRSTCSACFPSTAATGVARLDAHS